MQTKIKRAKQLIQQPTSTSAKDGVGRARLACERLPWVLGSVESSDWRYSKLWMGARKYCWHVCCGSDKRRKCYWPLVSQNFACQFLFHTKGDSIRCKDVWRTTYDGIVQPQKYLMLKLFVCSIFGLVPFWRNDFSDKNFPIYGTLMYYRISWNIGRY